MRTNWLAITLLGLPILLDPSRSQAQEQLFFDAVDVQVASVEVVVEDGKGNKISGLTAADFEILEDGVRQDVAYFSAQENGKAVQGEADAEADAGSLEATERVHLAIFVDDVHLAPQNRNRIFDRLKSYLETSLQPTDQVLIARLSDRLQIEQPFTDDVKILEATLDRLSTSAGLALPMDASYRRILREVASTALYSDDTSPGGGGPAASASAKISPKDSIEIDARNQARDILAFGEDRRQRVGRTILALRTAVGSLAGLRGRKALIYLSDGLPVRATEGLAEAWRDKYESWAARNDARSLLSELSRVRSLSNTTQEELDLLAQEASAARVAFYVLAPGGALTRGGGGADIGGSSSGGASTVRIATTTESFESETPLLQLAETTGGVARTRNFDINSLLAGVREDFGTFYSLGYKPKTEAKDQGREIRIKVRGRPDAVLRYTRHLGNEDAVEQLRELTLSALYHGLTNNPLQIELESQPAESLGDNQYRVDVLVKFPLEKILLLPQEDNHVGHLTLFVVVQDHKSQNLSTMSRVELPLRVPNDQILSAMMQKAAYPLKLEMRGGAQRLAIGIRDHLARVSATIEVDVDVPSSLAAITPAINPAEAPAAETKDGTPIGGAR